MNIIPKLSLNKHPKDNINLSLVNALNIKISNDESCITNEESIYINSIIDNFLINLYKDNNNINGYYYIKGIIPCNTELVLLTQSIIDTDKLDIIRYREKNINKSERIYCAYGGKNSEGNFINNRLSYHGGEIKGTFTYNVENNLIIAISEYNTINNELVPLKTINLGTFKETDNDEDNSDKNLPDNLLSIVPEVKIPSINNIEYINGNAYKGWYYVFIRYKINKNDYTQWYPIGYPIYIDTLIENQITRYCFNRSLHLEPIVITPNYPGFDSYYYLNVTFPNQPWDGYGVGCSDYFSDTTEIANETFSIELKDLDNNYNIYQLAFICSSKAYSKSFITYDIKNISNYTFNIKNVKEYSIDNIVNTYYNYYNVKNIINYKNRLYISNYKEKNKNDILNYINNIKISLASEYIIFDDIVTDNGIYMELNNRLQYYTNNISEIRLDTFLGIDFDQKITISFETSSMQDETIIRETKTIEDIKVGRCFICGTIDNCLDGGIFNSLTRGSNGYFTIVYLPESENGVSEYQYLVPSKRDSTFSAIYNITILNNNNTIKISRSQSAILRGNKFINTQNSFNLRKFKSTLIPGEVYNFFIHFVDKYGNATNGYRINNTDKIVAKTSIDSNDILMDDIIPIPVNFLYRIGDQSTKGYIAVNINESISDTITNFNNNLINTIYEKYDTKNRVLYSPRTDIEFINLIEDYKNFNNSTLKWFEIIDIESNLSKSLYGNFDVFINNNGDRLFKCPICNNTNSDYRLYYPKLENVVIPDGYVGYFISYEKPEYIKKVTGLLTRIDFRNIEAGYGYNNKPKDEELVKTKIIKNSGNASKSNEMLFFSNYFDIEDTLNLDYNLFRIENDLFDYNDIYNDYDTDLDPNKFNPYTNIPTFNDFQQRNHVFNYMHDLNKIEILKKRNYTNKIYPMPNYKLCIADSIKDNRVGTGTCLSIEDKYNLFSSYKANENIYNKINLYKISLLNSNTNIYTSNTKTLIKISEIYYNFDNGYVYLKNGLDGHYTYRGTIIYNETGLNFNETDKVARRIVDNYPYYPYKDLDENTIYRTYNLDIPFMVYLQHLEINNIMNESKCFKNSPATEFFVMKQKTTDSKEDDSKYWPGCIITPSNSIDLFENKQGSSDDFNPKTYTNYREDISDITDYNKTIRRSNVIQDESRINSWREFPLEAYKNINENKGNITNLIGIGTMLLIHTEHSLFIFDTSNELQTIDQNIQLSQPDAFDVNYKEILTSDLGFGGLQDNNAAIVDQFGYIFYDNSNNHFYQFDNRQLAIIDNDIIEWLLKYKPYNIRFANDKINNRLLIKMNYNINNNEYNTVLSYNYNIKSFISFHSYYFDKAYNTKSKLYFINTRQNILYNQKFNKILNFTNIENDYCNFKDMINSTLVNKRYNSKISIIINNDYDIIKYLEYIIYKLSKINITSINHEYSPVEEYKVPFSGNKLIVYNNEVNTGELNIEVNEEDNKNIFGSYNKPYWHLGNWNFSYLRNKINSYPNISATELSRIYGNYFIIEFIFNNNANENNKNEKIEFESLIYKLSK